MCEKCPNVETYEVRASELGAIQLVHKLCEPTNNKLQNYLTYWFALVHLILFRVECFTQ